MKKNNRASLSDAQKFSLVRREAIYTASLDVKIFHLPLWAVLGSVGVWLVAILISAVLSKKLFTDMDLGGEDDGR